MSRAPGQSPQKVSFLRHPWAGFLVAILAMAAYAATLGNGFVFDDRAAIETHPSLRTLENLPHLLVTPYWTGEGRSNRLYRPLTTISFALNAMVGSGSAWTFHLANLLLHSLVALVLLSLLQRLFGEGVLPLTGAALFSVHPLLSEAVVSVVGRAELFSAFFILAALWTERPPPLRGRRGMARSLFPPVLFLLALLSKENALAYPGLVLLTDSLLGRPEGSSRRRRIWEFSALLVVAGLYLLLRAKVLGALMEPGSIPDVDNPLAHVSAGRRVATALGLAVRYLGLFLFPLRLSADYSSPQILPADTFSDPRAILGTVVVSGLAILAFQYRRRLPPLAWGLGFAGCSFFLVSNLPFSIGTIFAERLMYLPCAGLCTVVGLLMSSSYAKRPRAAGALLVAILALMGFRTWDRSREWKNDFTLFKAASEISPQSAKVRYNLANAYRRQGDLPRAVENYRICLELHPDFEAAKRNLAVTLTEMGQGKEAEALLRMVLEKKPESGSLHNNLGNTYRAEGKLDLAEEAFRRALELEPNSPDPHNNLAALYQQKGDWGRAEEELREAIRLSSRPLPFLIHLGDLLLQRKRPGEAREVFSRAEEIDDRSAVVQRGQGEALLGIGKLDEAERKLRQSLALDPAQWEAPALLGFLCQQRGEGENAERYYLQSLAVRPGQPELHQNLGVLYSQRPGGREKALEQFRLCLTLSPAAETARSVNKMVEELEKESGGKR